MPRLPREAAKDPVQALAVSSLGEAVVPVGRDREILGPSILNFDSRGAEYVEGLRAKLDPEELYRVNGNPLENWYTLPKLLWIKDKERELYERTFKFLHWGAFVPFMLGADPAIDYSLANRSLLFDMDARMLVASISPQTAGIRHGKAPRARSVGIRSGTGLPQRQRGSRGFLREH